MYVHCIVNAHTWLFRVANNGVANLDRSLHSWPGRLQLVKMAIPNLTKGQDMTDERKPTTDEAMGIAWWNGLTEQERARWMQAAGNTGVAADAWAALKEGRAAP